MRLILTYQAVLVSRRFLVERKESDEKMNVVKCENGQTGRERELPVLCSILWILSNISSSLSVMITIIFWAALYNPQWDKLDFNNFSGHLFLAIRAILIEKSLRLPILHVPKLIPLLDWFQNSFAFALGRFILMLVFFLFQWGYSRENSNNNKIWPLNLLGMGHNHLVSTVELRF